ncbi:hypothetical protein [Oerskovia gallyi]|uniref:Secreted protein n=1 Tax=Oerskovia gallyi TaxID=2762226 RepID=A0ABR8UWT1_9CELL|nr:hypothetical protein [Oerskovia gallyi]MBD7996978.1 hypothetical protein [Oerskovia gallyi]
MNTVDRSISLVSLPNRPSVVPASRRRRLALTAAALGLAVGLTGCSLSSDDLTASGETAAQQPSTTTPDAGAAPVEPAAPPESPVAEAGTRANPHPVGTAVANEDWSIVVGAPREAWGEISAENQFNSPPEAGLEYWIVPLTATYQGATSGTPWLDLSVKFVGDDSVTYEGYCGVIPNNIQDVGELYAGGVAEGNACVAVPAGAPGLWTVTTGWGDPAFFTAR